jgi:lysophospholipase L1-like esterase
MKKISALISILLLLTSFAPQKTELTWMAIGDSITWLDGRPEETGNRDTTGYMSLVTKAMPNIHFTNNGHSGWTASHFAAGIETLLTEKADIYTIFFGTNDWWGAFPIGTLSDYQNASGNKTMYGAFRTIINKIRSLNPDAHIILMTPLQRGDFVYVKRATNNAWGSYKENKNGQKLSEYADAVKDIANLENFKVVDLYYDSGITPKNVMKYKRLKDPRSGAYKNYTYPEYTTIPFDPTKDEYPYPLGAMGMTYDGLHPSDKGMAVIAKMLVKVMKKY